MSFLFDAPKDEVVVRSSIIPIGGYAAIPIGPSHAGSCTLAVPPLTVVLFAGILSKIFRDAPP
jgi:hypothetical protein